MFLYKKITNIDFNNQKKIQNKENKIKYFYIFPMWKYVSETDIFFIYNYN